MIIMLRDGRSNKDYHNPFSLCYASFCIFCIIVCVCVCVFIVHAAFLRNKPMMMMMVNNNNSNSNNN